MAGKETGGEPYAGPAAGDDHGAAADVERVSAAGSRRGHSIRSSTRLLLALITQACLGRRCPAVAESVDLGVSHPRNAFPGEGDRVARRIRPYSLLPALDL